MTRWLVISAGVVTAVALVAGLAFSQPKASDCGAARTPEKVEGQVVSVDLKAGTVTILEKDGTKHVFQASRETLQDMKPGEAIQAKLREAPKC